MTTFPKHLLEQRAFTLAAAWGAQEPDRGQGGAGGLW